MGRGASHAALGIDFGTSNSAVSYKAADGLARLVPLEGAATALPTAVFFNQEDHSTHFGSFERWLAEQTGSGASEG